MQQLEPGELKAIQGGIGPLSFMGSRYGLALIVMVSHAAMLALGTINSL
jgi:hypothetical protein